MSFKWSASVYVLSYSLKILQQAGMAFWVQENQWKLKYIFIAITIYRIKNKLLNRIVIICPHPETAALSSFTFPIISSTPHHSHVLCCSHSDLLALLLTHHTYSFCHTFILPVFSIWNDLLHTFQGPTQVSLPLPWQLIISCSFSLYNFYIYLHGYLVSFISTFPFLHNFMGTPRREG